MLCDKCNVNEASIHISKIINGKKMEMNLCDKCAKEKTTLEVIGDIEYNSFDIDDLFSGLIKYIGTNTFMYDKEKRGVCCKSCGTTFIQFKNTGLMGCDQCYETFKMEVEPLIKRIQGNSSHVGKIPNSQGGVILLKKRIKKLTKNWARKHAIYGSAVVPNLEADKEWQSQFEKFKVNFHKDLNREKAELAGKVT